MTRLAPGIVISKGVCFGRPRLETRSIPAQVISIRYQCGESMRDIAEDYAISIEQVEDAIRWMLLSRDRRARLVRRVMATWAWVLLLALLPAWAQADEPFVTKPARTAAVLIYGGGLAGDMGTTLWARSRGAVELNPALQDSVVMVATRAALAALWIWLDPKLPPALRWLCRIVGGGYYIWRSWHNLQAGKDSRRP